MFNRIFTLKVINIESKILAYPQIIDRIAEQIELVITQLWKESKFWVHQNLKQTSFSLTCSFKFTYICIANMSNLKRNFIKENQKPFTVIKNTAKCRSLSQIYITGRL